MPVAVAFNARPKGRSAILAAMEWARVHETSVLVLHVQDTGVTGTAGLPADDASVESVREQVAAITADLTDPSTPQWQVISLTSAGDVASALLEMVRAHDVDVLVVGSQKRSELGKYLAGRTVQRVLLDSPVPVLVVKSSPKA
ncbi:universal stress protein [Ornithinimicrobium cryptoxanthini]|uniref:Universal stress protein n=1 Tax=Ornithinimicrobium cryptoxanthini TaxID=2934161 RepID=A0ABY4YF68_9MICO|nr:universal stress protein [Ornithinimicrobium cryptoxanthini]USQ74900.1 universal stress protein [Ornithinimicrobium cryptoxanthini]